MSDRRVVDLVAWSKRETQGARRRLLLAGGSLGVALAMLPPFEAWRGTAATAACVTAALVGGYLVLSMDRHERLVAGGGLVTGAGSTALGALGLLGALREAWLGAGDWGYGLFCLGLALVGWWLVTCASPSADFAFGRGGARVPLAQSPRGRPFQKKNAFERSSRPGSFP